MELHVWVARATAMFTRARTQSQAQRNGAWGGHGALSCNWVAASLRSDDRSLCRSNSSRCALLRMNRCVHGCDVLALLLLESVLLPCPTLQMAHPGAVLRSRRRSTTRILPSWPRSPARPSVAVVDDRCASHWRAPAAGQDTACSDRFSWRKHPGFGSSCESRRKSAAETQCRHAWKRGSAACRAAPIIEYSWAGIASFNMAALLHM